MTASRLRPLVPWIIAAVLCLAFDRAVWLRVSIKDAAAQARIESTAWHQLAYVTGTVYPWLLLGLAFFLEDHARARPDPRRRATFLILATVVAGVGAEVLKIVFRRVRPEYSDGWPRFRPLSENFFDAGGLGFPSSHAAVSFAAAFVLCRLHPGCAIVAVGLALLCAVSRVVVGAHFLSDVFGGMLVGYGAARAIYALDRRNNGGTGIDGSHA